MTLPTRILNDARAIRTLASWVGAGNVPVPAEQAAARANVCRQCPHNLEQHTIERDIGRILRDSEKVRKAIGAVVPDESNLKTCGLCNCYLPLKIWVPLRHLPTDGPEFPAHCWIASERVTTERNAHQP
jgi:hypothetical protein